MKLRIYVDEDAMDNDVVRALRSRNVDVRTAYEAGMARSPDDEHLGYAAA